MWMPRWSTPRGTAAIAVLALIAPTPVAAASAVPEGPYPARIEAGTCADPGDVVAPLGDVSAEFLVDGTPSAGQLPVGSTGAPPIAASVTTVAVPLVELVAGTSSIEIDADDGVTALVCGEIGGRLLGGTELPVALGPVEGSGYHGLAVLRDLGDGRTTVALYLTRDVAGAPSGTPTGTQTVEVGSSAYFSGFDVTVERATYDPVAGSLEITATFENLGTGTADLTSLQLNGHPVVLHGTDSIPLRVAGVAAPPGAVTRTTLTSGNLPDGFSLDGATLVLGQADQHRATVELSPGGIAVSEAPQRIQLPQKARSASLKGIAGITISRAQLVAAGCAGGRDDVVFTPGPATELSLVLTVTVRGRARLGALINTIATAPDGTSGVGGPGVLSIRRGETARDLLYCYTVPAPGPGRYSVRFEGGDRRDTIGFRVPAPP
jgi:hypothetical protein